MLLICLKTEAQVRTSMVVLKVDNLIPGMGLIEGITMHMTVAPLLITITPMDSTLPNIQSTKMVW
jgi:hypothetical protein